MLWIFGIIALLVAVLLVPNALYAFRRFLSNRNLVWFSVYMSFLILLGYLMIHITSRTADLVIKAKEVYDEPGP